MIIKEQLDTPLKKHLHTLELIRICKKLLQNPEIKSMPDYRHSIVCRIQTLKKELTPASDGK